MCKILTSILVFFFGAFGCNAQVIPATNKEFNVTTTDSLLTKSIYLENSEFLNLAKIDTTFSIAMAYATTENFLGQKVYQCEACYLRKKTIDALTAANNKFKKRGYRIKIFDCYRPLDVQKIMWKLVPDPQYVANPATGSIHNRGGAVDITLADENGNELDMGTKFDFFGEEAGHKYKNLSKEILKNRKLLKKIMRKNGFESFDSEWWHYNLKGARKMALANFQWQCE